MYTQGALSWRIVARKLIGSVATDKAGQRGKLRSFAYSTESQENSGELAEFCSGLVQRHGRSLPFHSNYDCADNGELFRWSKFVLLCKLILSAELAGL